MKDAASRILLLDADVVECIAAGEVIDRPASVVKELVENALDAGARRVDVETVAGGRTLIRVADDGCGMTLEEAELSLHRHATSKLQRVEDLEMVRTLGFRGEGLTSVAAISRLTLTTRTEGSPRGTELYAEAQRVVRRQPAAGRSGTTLAVRDLFFNTPARLKFLKSTATESAHISDTLTRMAYAFHRVHFTLQQDGRSTWVVPAASDRLDRARSLLRARRMASGECEPTWLSEEIGRADVVVAACLSPPGSEGRSTRFLTLLVNRRPVRDRALLQAIVAGYGGRLQPGRYPVGVVHIDIDPAAVDVNVHPQKTEVRFVDLAAVCRAVRECVQAALEKQAAPGETVSRTYRIGDAGSAREASGGERMGREGAQRFWVSGSGVAREKVAQDYGLGAALARAEMRDSEAPGEEKDPIGAIALVGTVCAQLLVCRSGSQLLLIDARAGWRFVLARRLRAQLASGGLSKRQLTRPLTVQLDRRFGDGLERGADRLSRFGVEIEAFGGGSWIVRALPALLMVKDPQECAEAIERGVVELVAELVGAGGADETESVRDERALRCLAAAGAASYCEAREEGQGTASDQTLLAALEEIGVEGCSEVVSVRPRAQAGRGVGAEECPPVLVVESSELRRLWRS